MKVGTVTCLCGWICSGKTVYARQLCRDGQAVLLSADEICWDLYRHDMPDFDATAERIKQYLHKKACEIARAGTDVVLDWGFWGARERAWVRDFYAGQGIPLRWIYLSVASEDWKRNIEMRNL